MEICKMNQNKDKLVEIGERVFLLLFFIYAFLGSNSFTYGRKIITYVMWVTFLTGGLLLAYRLVHFKSYCRMPGIVFLLCMLGSMGISILVNYRYALKENVIFAIYWLFYFVLLYIQKDDAGPEAFRKKFEFVAALFVIYMSLGVLLSYILMLSGHNGVFHAPDTNFEYRIGFSIGRLWGTFINPNGASFAASVSAVFLLYFMAKHKKLVIRLLCGTDIFLLLFYVALADSRSGAICFGIMTAVFSFVLLWYRNKGKGWIYKGLTLLTAAVIFVCGFYLPRLMKDGYNQIILSVSHQEGDEGTASKEPDFVVERGYDLSQDISNRRFDIWKSAVEIYTSSPKTMIFGTSFRGIVPYAREYLPNTYIVNNDGAVFETMENEFFNILVSQGILGIVSVAAFAVFLLVYIVKRLFRLKKEYIVLAGILLAVVLGEGAICMLSALAFYHFSQCSLIFWFALGGLVFVLQHGRESSEHAVAR